MKRQDKLEGSGIEYGITVCILRKSAKLWADFMELWIGISGGLL
jgi:hypothetical protein